LWIKDLGRGSSISRFGWVFQAAFEYIGDEHLDGQLAGLQLADAADDQGKDRRAAVLALVAC
jgi:hypothetical protein